jgi:chemotaxis protein methyltransferase CheR
MITDNYQPQQFQPMKQAVMSEREFTRLSEFIYKTCGIKLPSGKRTMLEARLSKRLRVLGLKGYDAYCDYLFSDDGMHEELVSMIDLVTTNKTEFFRESPHFDYLARHAVPDLMRRHGAGMQRPFVIWSAGCSTGEEPYTLAMVLSELAAVHRGFRFLILATDISTRVLDAAKNAVYDEEKVGPVPDALRRKYLLRGKNAKSGLYRIVPELRELVRFRRLNFMDGDFGMREPMDVIFCRNVIIYFDRPTQERLLKRFCSHLFEGGYLFMGHSETVHGMDLPVTPVAPTVYRKGKLT